MKRKTFRIREECWVTEENSPLMICLYPLSCIFLDLSDCLHHSNLQSTSILPIGHSHACSLHFCYYYNASLCKQKFPSRAPTQTHSVACLHTHVWIYLNLSIFNLNQLLEFTPILDISSIYWFFGKFGYFCHFGYSHHLFWNFWNLFALYQAY